MGKVEVDTLILAGWVLPVAPDENISLKDHAVAVVDGKILDILPNAKAEERYTAIEFLDRKGSVVMPGLINAHIHTGMTFLRGRADDRPLLEWLQGTVWPLEAKFGVSEEHLEDAAMLAIAEMIRGGVTCYSDMYFFPGSSASAAVRTGIRAMIGLGLIGFPTPYAASIEEYITRGHEVLERFKNEHRIYFAYAPHAPYTVPTEGWLKMKKLQESSGFRIHTHLHETQDECSASLILDRENPACHQSENKCHPIEDFNRMGLLSAKLVAVHMVHLTDDEIQLIAEKGVNVVHCPTSNAKLASGFCRTPELIKAGVNIALGTDSSASNNSLDILSEMKMAALMAKNMSLDATVVPAPMAIRMGTINGARALGLDDVTGSLEVGKSADLICINVETHAGNSPMYSPHAAIVYAATREDVSDVMVDGKFLLQSKEYRTLDIKDILRRSKHWQSEILAVSDENQ